MEFEERPRKLQKVDHGEISEIVEVVPSDPQSRVGQNEIVIDTLPYPQSGLTSENGQNTTNEAPLSKNQQKKLRKTQEWEAGREWRRQRQKEKLAEKKERKRISRSMAEQSSDVKGDQEGGVAQGSANSVAALKKRPQRRSVRIPVSIILDCSFDELMVEKERISLAAQITRCYSDVKNALYRPHLAVSSFNDLLKDRFEGPLGKQYHNWKAVAFTSEGFVNTAKVLGETMAAKGNDNLTGALATAVHKDGDFGEEGEVVYLSSDSPHTLAVLNPHSVYIVGGLVDKNRHKGICYKRAIAAGVKTAKLPIGEYLEMSSRSVLATNHVVEIMVKWLELGDWGQAFMAVMPKRKGGTLKSVEKDLDYTESANAVDSQSEEESIKDGTIENTEVSKLSEAGHSEEKAEEEKI